MTARRAVLVTVLAWVLGTSLTAWAAAPLPGAKRVLFLGDSITYAGGYTEYIDTWFVTR